MHCSVWQITVLQDGQFVAFKEMWYFWKLWWFLASKISILINMKFIKLIVLVTINIKISDINWPSCPLSLRIQYGKSPKFIWIFYLQSQSWNSCMRSDQWNNQKHAQKFNLMPPSCQLSWPDLVTVNLCVIQSFTKMLVTTKHTQKYKLCSNH